MVQRLNSWIRSRPIFGRYGSKAVWFVHVIIVLAALGILYGLFFGG